MYYRVNTRVFFITPTIAVGTDVDNRAFIELAWLCFAVGIGEV